MRICLGVAIFFDLIDRINYADLFYSSIGFLPLGKIEFQSFSILYIQDNPGFVLFIFISSLICCSLFTVGYKTKHFAILTWLLIISIQNRNPFILYGADTVVRVMLFWCIFLPINECFSLDRVLSTNTTKRATAENDIYGLAYFFQVFIIYFTTAALKNSSEWIIDHTALLHALQLEYIAKPWTAYLLQFPGLLKFLTLCTLYLERLAPFFLLVPITSFRTITILVLIVFHLATGLTFYIGVFPMVCSAALIGLMPAGGLHIFADRFEKVVKRFSWSRAEIGLTFKVTTLKPRSWRYTGYIKLALYSVSFIFLIAWFLSRMGIANPSFFDPIRAYGNFMRLDQDWAMFAPTVSKEDNWFILEGKTKEGFVDLSEMRYGINEDKDHQLEKLHDNIRLGYFLWSLKQHESKDLWYAFCQSLRIKWNQDHPYDPVLHITIWNYVEPTSNPADISKLMLYSETF